MSHAHSMSNAGQLAQPEDAGMTIGIEGMGLAAYNPHLDDSISGADWP